MPDIKYPTSKHVEKRKLNTAPIILLRFRSNYWFLKSYALKILVRYLNRLCIFCNTVKIMPRIIFKEIECILYNGKKYIFKKNESVYLFSRIFLSTWSGTYCLQSFRQFFLLVIQGINQNPKTKSPEFPRWNLINFHAGFFYAMKWNWYVFRSVILQIR